jgi:HlyD family secretion protein
LEELKMKKIVIAVVAAALALGGYLYFSAKEKAEEQAAAPRPTAVAEKGDLTISVDASGRVEADRLVEIKSKASGEVIQINADISDEVKAGMLLFKLDPVDEERSVKKLQATLSMSKAKLEQQQLAVKAAEAKLAADTARAAAGIKSAEAERTDAATKLRRSEELHKASVITREELDTAVTADVKAQSALENARAQQDDLAVQALELDRTRQDIAIASAQVENDTVALDDAQQRLKETEVFAPIDGVISDRTIQEGLIIASGVSNVGGGTTAMKIIDLSRVYTIAAVDEADIAGVVPGVKARITADAFKNMTFPGTVVRVAATGLVESNVVTFDVKVEVEGRRKNLLKPEMTTNVTFIVDERKDVVLVPSSAVVRRAARVEAAEGEAQPRVDYRRRESFVTVLKADGTEEERKVEPGITDGNNL